MILSQQKNSLFLALGVVNGNRRFCRGQPGKINNKPSQWTTSIGIKVHFVAGGRLISKRDSARADMASATRLFLFLFYRQIFFPLPTTATFTLIRYDKSISFSKISKTLVALFSFIYFFPRHAPPRTKSIKIDEEGNRNKMKKENAERISDARG